MKKLNKIIVLLVAIVLVTIPFIKVNAETSTLNGKGAFECIFNENVYYEGEPIKMTLKLADDYVKDNNMITDFEINLTAGFEDENPNGEYTFISMVPVLEKSKYSYPTERLYYIQAQSLAQKIGLKANTILSTGEDIIHPDETANMFNENDAKLEKEYTALIRGKAYWSNDNIYSVLESYTTKVVAFEVGDLTRDHEVDFFDIIQLISVVYDGDESMLDWRQKYSVTTNTKEWFDKKDENPEYDYKTAYLGFADIIYLIKTVYD